MKTTESFRFSDPIRKRTVSATPEESVRQALLRKMVEDLGYPKAFIVVEQKIPHLRRRVDLICYTNQIDPQELLPLLVVECKAKSSLNKAYEQLLGYNSALKAPFLCVANEKEIETFWLEGKEMKRVSFLLVYQELCQLLK